ncbi:MAG: hypothetical protein A4E40_01263 [Methanoregulaceae archaeon PtaU1.Bin059]|nr:MAG: hypothetical protein A4E40_01263 [Methanoregulaceae archaeon PtaU1.Bin059]
MHALEFLWGISGEAGESIVVKDQFPVLDDEDPVPVVFYQHAVLLLALLQRDFRLLSPDSLPHLVREFGKLRLRIAAFLEIEVCSVVDSGDHDLFAASAGEEDERDVAEPQADCFQELDPVHARHLVIGDDGIIGHDLVAVERLLSGCRCPYEKSPGLLKEHPGKGQEGWFIIDAENTDTVLHMLSRLVLIYIITWDRTPAVYCSRPHAQIFEARSKDTIERVSLRLTHPGSLTAHRFISRPMDTPVHRPNRPTEQCRLECNLLVRRCQA